MVNKGLTALVLAAMGVVGCQDLGRPINCDIENKKQVTESVSSGDKTGKSIEDLRAGTLQKKKNAEVLNIFDRKVPKAYALSQMSFEDAAKELNDEFGYDVTPKFLVEQSRLWFLEAGKDQAAFNAKDVHLCNSKECWDEGAYEYDKLIEGYIAVVHAGLINRWKVDNEMSPYEGLNCRDVAIFSKDGDLMGVINDKIGTHNNRREYNAFRHFPWAFQKKSLKEALASGKVFSQDEVDLIEEGDGIYDAEVRANLALLTFYGCLTEELKDNTSGSVSYRADAWGDEHLKDQYGIDEAYCKDWDIDSRRTHPTDQFQCAVECSYDLNSAILKKGSHEFRGLDVTKTEYLWHNGVQTSK